MTLSSTWRRLNNNIKQHLWFDHSLQRSLLRQQEDFMSLKQMLESQIKVKMIQIWMLRRGKVLCKEMMKLRRS